MPPASQGIAVYVPSGVTKLKGVYIGQAGNPLDSRDIAHTWQFLLVQVDEAFKQEQATPGVVPKFLSALATKIGRPEVATAPVVYWLNQFTNEAMPALLADKDRFIAFGHFTGAARAMYQAGMAGVPSVEASEDAHAYNVLSKAWKPGHLVTMSMMWDYGHAIYTKLETYWVYFDRVMRMRMQPGKPLRAIREEEGWLGDLSSFSEYPAIAPFADYKGDRTKATWLPDKYFAHYWQAYMSRKPVLRIVGDAAWMYTKRQTGKIPDRSAVGSGLRHFVEPNAPFAIRIGPEPALSYDTPTGLAAGGPPSVPVKKVEFYDGDVFLGERTSPPYDLEGVRLTRPGLHALIAIAVLPDGRKSASRPALLVVKGDMYGGAMEPVVPPPAPSDAGAGPDAAISMEPTTSGPDASGSPSAPSPISPPRRDASYAATEDDDDTAEEARRPRMGGCSVGPQRASGGALLFVLWALAMARRRFPSGR